MQNVVNVVSLYFQEKQTHMKDLSLSRLYRKYHTEDFLFFNQKENFVLYLQSSNQKTESLVQPFFPKKWVFFNIYLLF